MFVANCMWKHIMLLRKLISSLNQFTLNSGTILHGFSNYGIVFCDDK